MVFNLYLNAARPHVRHRFGATDIAGVLRQARVSYPRGSPYEMSLYHCAYYCDSIAALLGYEIEIRKESLFYCGPAG